MMRTGGGDCWDEGEADWCGEEGWRGLHSSGRDDGNEQLERKKNGTRKKRMSSAWYLFELSPWWRRVEV